MLPLFVRAFARDPATEQGLIILRCGTIRDRFVSIRLDAREAEILWQIFVSPGEPQLGPEFMYTALLAAGVSIVSMRMVQMGPHKVRFYVTFRNRRRTWTMVPMPFDALGLSLTSHVPIRVAEASFRRMSESDLEPEPLPPTQEAIVAKAAASAVGPKDKLGQS